jgi:peptide/nickel transport system substrate-binding protein
VGLTALAAAATLVLAACGGSSSSTTTSSTAANAPAGSGEATSGGGAAAGSGSAAAGGDSSTITFAAEQEFYDYNTGTTSGNATANGTVLNQVLRGFSYVDNKLQTQRDTEFGSFEKVSDSPLTVKYTFNDKAVWSDGTPIDCADFLLGWAASSGRYNKDGTVNQPNQVPAEPAYLFDAASTTGLDQTQKPTCADGDKSVTLVYDTPFVDWQLAIATSAGASLMPAHVVAKQAGTDTAGLIKAIETDDAATLAKAAAFWNTGWTIDKAKGLPDASLIPSSGPFYVAAYDPGQSVTLKKNDKWWGTPAKADTVVFRFISQDQQVSALSSGEVDVIEPQPNPDTNAALTALGDSVKADFGPLATYEHMDLSVKNGFANEKLREALFKCAPRQQIVDNLVVPSNPDAVLLNSLMLMNFQEGYDQIAAASGFEAYAEPDIDGAKAAYAASGEAAGKTIRVIHIDPNPRRTNEVALLKASCDPVGFNIQDVPLSSTDFGAARAAGDYDIALFAWATSGLLGSISAQYQSTGPQNTAGWNDPAIDTAFNTLNTSTDPAAAQALLTTVDQGLAKNLYSFPIFTFPGAVAMRSNITGPVLNAGQTQATWNMQDWERTG